MINVAPLLLRRALIGAAIIAANSAGAQTTYRSATIDSASRLRLITTSGRTISPSRDSDQVGFEAVSISRDRRSVGWLALYPNCCTTYPIPLRLVVRTADRVRVFEGSGLPIWAWTFIDGGRVAFQESPVHGDAPLHYELRDVRSGALVEQFDWPTGEPKKLPNWVRTLDRTKPPPV